MGGKTREHIQTGSGQEVCILSRMLFVLVV